MLASCVSNVTEQIGQERIRIARVIPMPEENVLIQELIRGAVPWWQAPSCHETWSFLLPQRGQGQLITRKHVGVEIGES